MCDPDVEIAGDEPRPPPCGVGRSTCGPPRILARQMWPRLGSPHAWQRFLRLDPSSRSLRPFSIRCHRLRTEETCAVGQGRTAGRRRPVKRMEGEREPGRGRDGKMLPRAADASCQKGARAACARAGLSHRSARELLDDGLPLGALRSVHFHDDVVLLGLPRLHVLMSSARHAHSFVACREACAPPAPMQARQQ